MRTVYVGIKCICVSAVLVVPTKYCEKSQLTRKFTYIINVTTLNNFRFLDHTKHTLTKEWQKPV